MFAWAVFFGLIACATAVCPNGASEYDGRCYGALNSLFAYNISTGLCKTSYNQCSQLPVVDNSAQNSFLASWTRNNGIWYIWLQYYSNGTSYVDLNGKPPTYQNWAIDEPSSISVGYCAVIGDNGNWYAQSCQISTNTLCQFTSPCDAPTTATTTTTTTTTPSNSPQYPTCVQKYLNFVPCASGWEYYPPSCACYRIIQNSTFANALNICRSLRGSLASIHNSGEAAFITRLAAETRSPWIVTGTWRDNIIIGLQYSGNTMSWVDGTPFDYPHGLAPGEPSINDSTGQLILTNPMGHSTYMQLGQCYTNTCRYAVCQLNVY